MRSPRRTLVSPLPKDSSRPRPARRESANALRPPPEFTTR